MNTEITVICNIRDEEEALPYWLSHHKDMFDHGIVIDYESRDRSVQIVKSICPTWEIVKPKVLWIHGSAEQDVEIIETSLSGWKIALNVTEYILNPNLHEYVEKFEQKHPSMVGVRALGVNLVDREPGSWRRDVPILKQKTFGYFDHDLIDLQNMDEDRHGKLLVDTRNFITHGIDGRSRLLHKADRGLYNQGRHTTRHENIWPNNRFVCPESDFIVCWTGWSPYELTQSRPVYSRRYTDWYEGQSPEQNLKRQQAISKDLLQHHAYKVAYEQRYGKDTSNDTKKNID